MPPFSFSNLTLTIPSLIAVEKCSPILLLKVNSADSWGRHRVEGYGYLRFPAEQGYHSTSVSTWRPRASLDTEIHSFFLGGSVRIRRLEEIVRTAFMDSNGQCELVNRFGLETEDAGRIKINLNIATQDTATSRYYMNVMRQVKRNEKLEARKLVMKYSLDIKK